jgi:hypothetical protein
MRNLWASRGIWSGVAGAVLGGLVEAWGNRLAGTTVITDGMIWGAVVAILLVSLPNFTRMGRLTVKSDKPAVNFVVGVGMFILISLVLIVIFWGVFWILGRLL